MKEIEFYKLSGGDGVSADFCLTAIGDSMKDARILDGDIVFISKRDHVKNGDIAAVLVDHVPILKRFFYYEKYGMVILKSENTKYPDIIYHGDQLTGLEILGKAVAFQSCIK